MVKGKYSLFLNRLDFKNAGDVYSSPYHYINRPGALLDCFLIDPERDLETFKNFDTLIVGGGALLQNTRMFNSISNLLSSNNFQNKILWGVGVQTERINEEQELISKFNLVGVRDFDKGYNFLPCASCMHPLFKKSVKSTNRVLIVDHWKRRPIWVPFDNYTRIQNTEIFIDTIISLIQSHEIIITSSYHAAYWSLLSGKKVMIVSNPMTDKLKNFHVSVPYDTEFNIDIFENLKTYPTYYQECLDINHNFLQQVENLIL